LGPPQRVRIPCPVAGSPATGKPLLFLGLRGPATGGWVRIATASRARPCAAQASPRQKYAGADIENLAYSRNWGYGRSGGLGLVLVIVVVLLLLGYMPRGF
jgi:hypothetical protein